MTIANSVSFLRRVLFADAALSTVMALLLIFSASTIASITALPEILLSGAGWALVPWVVVVVFAAPREHVRPALIWTIVALNSVWAIESVALLFMESIEANALGIAFVLAQALVVALLAILQASGLRAHRQAAAG